MWELRLNQVVVCGNECQGCGVWHAASDNFCASCGKPTSSSDIITVDNGLSLISSPGQPAFSSSNSSVSASSNEIPISTSPAVTWFLTRRWAIVAVLLAVGPMGLPALWLSPRFSRPIKITLTLVYFLVTAVIPVAVAWYFLDVSLRPLVDVMRVR